MSEVKKENKLVAILLLIASILVGGAVWGLLFKLGIFVALVAYGTALLAFFLYSKFAKLNKTVYICACIGIVVVNVASLFLALAIDGATELNITIGETFEIIFNNFEEFALDLLTDTIIAIVFSILGVVSYVKYDQQKQAKTPVTLPLTDGKPVATEEVKTEDTATEEKAEDKTEEKAEDKTEDTEDNSSEK